MTSNAGMHVRNRVPHALPGIREDVPRARGNSSVASSWAKQAHGWVPVPLGLCPREQRLTLGQDLGNKSSLGSWESIQSPAWWKTPLTMGPQKGAEGHTGTPAAHSNTSQEG